MIGVLKRQLFSVFGAMTRETGAGVQDKHVKGFFSCPRLGMNRKCHLKNEKTYPLQIRILLEITQMNYKLSKRKKCILKHLT